jgi:alpha-beta hydrolase superfamily lysophospholipase
LSSGKRGHARKFSYLLDDTEELLKTARVHYPDTTMILLGHSAGGTIVGTFLCERSLGELAGFILSSPWVKLAFEPPGWKVAAASVIRRLLPALTQPNDLDPALITRDPEGVTAYATDPLIHDRISVQSFFDLVKYGAGLLTKQGPQIPGLVYHGTGDHITSHEESDHLHVNWGTQWIAWFGSYHETHQDFEKKSVMDAVVTFVKNH